MGIVLGLVAALTISFLYNEKSKDIPVLSFFNKQMTTQEYKVYDMRFKIRGRLAEEKILKDIVLLDIDDESYEWATWPFDRTYYAEIVRALGTEGSKTACTFFDVFFFDPSGPVLNQSMTETFGSYLADLPESIEADTEMTGGIKEELYEISEELKKPLSDERINELRQRIDELTKNKVFTAYREKFQDTGLFFEQQSSLAELAPDRDHVFHSAIEYAGNVLLAQVVSKTEKTPYGEEDILFNPEIHDIFARLIQLSDRTQTRNNTEVEVNYLLRNMRPRDLKQVLEDSEKETVFGKTPLPFSEDVKKAIQSEIDELQAAIAYALETNYKFGADIRDDNPVPKEEILDKYIKIVRMTSVNPIVGEFAAGAGYVMPELQEDGIIRAIAPAVVFEDRAYFHVDLLMAMMYLGIGADDIDFYLDKIVLNNCNIPGSENTFSIEIPTYDNGKALVNWAGTFLEPNQFEHRSFKKTYEDSLKYNALTKFDRGEQLTIIEQETLAELTAEDVEQVKKNMQFFDGKIAMIGLTAEGTHDLNPIPLHPRYPLVGMHANMVNTIINRLFISTTPFGIFFAVILLLTVLVGFVGGTTKQSISSSVVVLIIAGYLATAILLFSYADIWIPVIPMLVSIVVSYLAVIIYRFMTEGKEAKKMKSMFSTYVNPEVVETLIHEPDKLRLGGEKMDLTAMFALAKGPGLSEAKTPEELVDRLNEYFTAMTDPIFDNQGMLDKYESAIIMAVFGAPIHYEDNAVKACHAAVDMLRITQALREKWKEEGKKLIDLSVGLNSGLMIAGNMGSESRFNYTIMGDAVNLSARLLGAGNQYGTNIMISEFTYDKAREEIITRQIDKIMVVGKNEPIRVYELIGKKGEELSESILKCKEHYEKGYALYLDMKWDEAREEFKLALEAKPDDKPSSIYIDRCADFKETPPTVGEDGKWDGVFVMKAKGV